MSSTNGHAETLIVAVDVASQTERELIRGWAERTHPGAAIIEPGDGTLSRRLAAGGDALVVPARVTWLPRERDGERSVRPADLLALSTPRRPWPVVQSRIANREPDRAPVTAGAPARVSDLHSRFEKEAGRHDGDAFAEFVTRQAVVACDRAERAIIGDRYKVPRLVAEQVAASAYFRAQVDKLAGELERDPDDVLAEATECLAELAPVQSPVAIDAFRLVMRPMHANAWNVEADVEGLERLRARNKEHGLIFLPTHRSYVDPLVLAEVLHANDFPRNHLLGGENMGFWPIGPLGKRAGVIFIRRSFGSDRVYKLAVREMLGHLVAKRFNIEWYIEGGRTRTGKLRPPKYGLLHYLASAIDNDRAEDVLLVPTSIVYSRLHEVTVMAAEHTGGTKRREGLHWMADYIRAQSSTVGTARIDFGEPLSLRGALADAGAGRSRLEKVAFRICDGINRVTPVTGTSLVTLALLGSTGRALTQAQVLERVLPLLDYLARRGIEGRPDELRRGTDLLAALASLVDAGVLDRFDGGTEPVWSIAKGAHHVAAFYRNGALHHFVLRAIVETILLHVAGKPLDGDGLEQSTEEALRLRDLLKFEFFFSDKQVFLRELRKELDLLDPEWRAHSASSEDAVRLLVASEPLMAHRVLRSFIEAQLIVAERLAALSPREPVGDDFLTHCLGVGEQQLRMGTIASPEAVSRELFASALRLAKNRDLVDPGRQALVSARNAWLEQVRDVADRLARIDTLDRANAPVAAAV